MPFACLRSTITCALADQPAAADANAGFASNCAAAQVGVGIVGVGVVIEGTVVGVGVGVGVGAGVGVGVLGAGVVEVWVVAGVVGMGVAGGVGGTNTVVLQEKVVCPDAPLVSVAVTVTVLRPACVGRPVIAPVEPIDRPTGSPVAVNVNDSCRESLP